MEKRRVRIGGAVLGIGQPAVCVPVLGKTMEEIRASARAALDAQADVIELRADSLCAMPSAHEAQAMCFAVRECAPGVGLLFTLRTLRDGGAGDGDPHAYEDLLCALAKAGCADALDVEISVGWEAFERIASCAHSADVAVVGSSHDFAATPPCEEICTRLNAMQLHGADVCKIAVMPESRLDVLALMRAAVMSDEALFAPVIAISMGPMGALSRIGGEAFGSCLTFGTAHGASAPGQIDAKQLRSALEIVHSAL